MHIQDTEQELEESADDFLGSLGLNTSIEPLNSNDAFYQELCGGKYSKIDNMIYWLRGEMSRFIHFQEHNCKLTRNIVKDGKSISKPLTRMEYARISIEYFFQMYHLPRFKKLNVKEPCDMQVMIDKVVAYPPMKEVIENYMG